MTEQEKREKVIKGLKYLHDVRRWSPDESEESITARRNITGDSLALLKAQEPLLVTHIHEEYPEHLWTKDENGNVNEWAMEFDYHQGPVCERCGDTFCIHCEPDGYITHKKCVVDVYKCPKCGSELWSNQKHCAKCGQAVKWDD